MSIRRCNSFFLLSVFALELLARMNRFIWLVRRCRWRAKTKVRAILPSDLPSLSRQRMYRSRRKVRADVMMMRSAPLPTWVCCCVSVCACDRSTGDIVIPAIHGASVDSPSKTGRFLKWRTKLWIGHRIISGCWAIYSQNNRSLCEAQVMVMCER